MGSQFYERTALSQNKVAMLTQSAQTTPTDVITPDEEIRDPLVEEGGSGAGVVLVAIIFIVTYNDIRYSLTVRIRMAAGEEV